MPPPGFKKAILAALPGTIHDIRAKTGLAESTIRRWARKLKGKGMRISRYKRTSGLYTPVYVIGYGPDAPKPVPLTNGEWCKNWRDRKRAAGELEFVYARRHAQDRARRALTKPQSWLSALGL